MIRLLGFIIGSAVSIGTILLILGIPEFWQRAVVGALILGAVVLDRLLAARRARRLDEERED